MKFYGEMRVQGGGPLDGSRFDALAYALAEIEATDPAIEEVDLTSSLAQGWVTASMTISQENLELAVAKLISTVRTAIYPNGDHAGGWQFLTETAGLSVHPVTDRAGANAPGQLPPPGPAAPAGPPASPETLAAPARPARPGAPPRPNTPSRPRAPVSIWADRAVPEAEPASQGLPGA
ncbi:MAG TPA: hypothetical protein VIE45_02755 [Streptosporangiaceae bacterium]